MVVTTVTTTVKRRRQFFRVFPFPRSAVGNGWKRLEACLSCTAGIGSRAPFKLCGRRGNANSVKPVNSLLSSNLRDSPRCCLHQMSPDVGGDVFVELRRRRHIKGRRRRESRRWSRRWRRGASISLSSPTLLSGCSKLKIPSSSSKNHFPLCN